MLLCQYLAQQSSAREVIQTRFVLVQEFAVGLDLSTLVDGLIASTAWDETVYVWPQGQDPRLV